MLERLTISRFKTIREQELSFGRVNLFIGGNGTGKSNLLEAIGLVSACLGRGLGDSDLGSKGLRITPPELMKSSFKNEGLPRTLELSAFFSNGVDYTAQLQSRVGDPLLRFFTEASHVQGNRIFGRSNRGAKATGVSHADRLDPTRGIWDQIKATYDIPSSATKVFAEFARFAIYSPQTDFLRGKQTGKIDFPPIGLHGEGLPEAVSAYLNTRLKYKNREARKPGSGGPDWSLLEQCTKLVWLPGWAESFGTHFAPAQLISRDVADRSRENVFFQDKFMHSTRNKLSVYDSSEGTLFLLFAAIVLSHPDAPKVFALDNVDNSLNPNLTRRLVETIIRVVKEASSEGATLGAKQVFLTSHNPTSLDAFDIFDEDQRIFVVRRSEKGHTIATRLVPPQGVDREKWQQIKSGRNLSQLWLDGDIPGALGAI